MNKWDKVFKSGLSKFCGRQHLKNLKGYGLLTQISVILPKVLKLYHSAKGSIVFPLSFKVIRFTLISC